MVACTLKLLSEQWQGRMTFFFCLMDSSKFFYSAVHFSLYFHPKGNSSIKKLEIMRLSSYQFRSLQSDIRQVWFHNAGNTQPRHRW